MLYVIIYDIILGTTLQQRFGSLGGGAWNMRPSPRGAGWRLSAAPAADSLGVIILYQIRSYHSMLHYIMFRYSMLNHITLYYT